MPSGGQILLRPEFLLRKTLEVLNYSEFVSAVKISGKMNEYYPSKGYIV